MTNDTEGVSEHLKNFFWGGGLSTALIVYFAPAGPFYIWFCGIMWVKLSKYIIITVRSGYVGYVIRNNDNNNNNKLIYCYVHLHCCEETEVTIFFFYLCYFCVFRPVLVLLRESAVHSNYILPQTVLVLTFWIWDANGTSTTS